MDMDTAHSSERTAAEPVPSTSCAIELGSSVDCDEPKTGNANMGAFWSPLEMVQMG